MAITKGSDAYCTVAESDTWSDQHPYGTAWSAVEDAQKERLIRMATRMLDDYVFWNGDPSAASQALAFPRTGLTDRNGGTIQAGVPDEIRDACAEFSRQLMAADRAKDDVLETKRITKAGDSEFDNPIAKPVPDAVQYLIPSAWYSGIRRLLNASALRTVALARA